MGYQKYWPGGWYKNDSGSVYVTQITSTHVYYKKDGERVKETRDTFYRRSYEPETPVGNMGKPRKGTQGFKKFNQSGL